MHLAFSIIAGILQVYSIMIFICIIISYFPELRRTKGAGILSDLVDPFLAPFRKYVPSIGNYDISGLVALILLQFAIRGLTQW